MICSRFFQRAALVTGGLTSVALLAIGFALAQTAPTSAPTLPNKKSVPPPTWTEHWFEHNQTVRLAANKGDVALYFDADVPPSTSDWMMPFLTELWKYTKKTYGAYGAEGRLYAVLHQGRYSGGHPSTYFDASHDLRNVIDCGPGPWDPNRPGIIDIPSHEVGHIVEGASRGVRESPAFGIWGDSKWIEFYQYDAYRALGRDADAKRLYDKFIATKDRFPRADTYWFRDWYYPLWRDYGHAKVMANYFKLLAKNFPSQPEGTGQGKEYTRNMNWGEYIHFMSGAAGVDLKPLATRAFGWPDEWETQFRKAQQDFPAVKYKAAR